MTIEEARIRVKNLISDAKLYDGKAFKLHLADSEIEALEVVIKSSEQEPCGKDINVPATDAISRQDVVKAVDKHTNDDGTLDDDITCILEDVPSVTPQPKTGYWIYKTVRGEKVPCCSRCGLDSGTGYEFDFCPRCGAKMLPQPYKAKSEE